MMCFDPIIEEACEQLFWIRHDLSSAQDALLEASQDSFTSVVSVETAKRIRTVLGTIRNGLAMLSNLAGSLGAQQSVFPLVPAVDIGDPDSSLAAGRDLPAPNAPSFLLDACKTMHNFQDHVDILSIFHVFIILVNFPPCNQQRWTMVLAKLLARWQSAKATLPTTTNRKTMVLPATTTNRNRVRISAVKKMHSNTIL